MNEKINKKFTVYTDCLHFLLDRPCIYQKNENMHCPECGKYEKISAENPKKRILIIKLGAMGDVLRTTFLLEGLKELYPSSLISWIVNKNNSEVLVNNDYIDEIIYNDDKTLFFLINNYFDIVINLDLAPESMALAKLSNNSKVIGYTLDNTRNVTASNSYAQDWLKMSAYDELKKANKLTYQYWMSKITEIPRDNYEIVVPIQSSSSEKASKFLKDNNIKTDKKIIGINPGAGKRWKLKKWRTEGFVSVAQYFSKKEHVVLLLGGKEDEEDINVILEKKLPNVFFTGINNYVPDFFAMINLCDIILCGDTMALHAAAGLKKNIVSLFGPTSLAEIEVYGRGVKIQPAKECIGCYRQECDKEITCMDEIAEKTVIDAIEKYI